MRKVIVALILLSLVFVIGMSSCEPTCNPPYIQVGYGCCLDQNNNIICDKDESNITSEVQETTKISSSKSSDNLIDQCTTSFNECKSIATKKSGISISILEKGKFEDMITAEEFYKTWGFIFTMESQEQLYNGKTLQFPVVLIASKMTGSEGQIPFVAVCQNDGKLTSSSKANMLCGA